MRPAIPMESIGRNDATGLNPPSLGTITANCSASAIPTKITVRNEDKRILRNRLRIQIPRATNAFNAIGAILQASELLAQIADMRIDAAVIGRKLAPQYSSHQVFAVYNLACDFHQRFE